MCPILLQAGPFTLHTYGLMIAIGFLIALRVSRVQFERFALPGDLLDKIVFWVMVCGILGARLMYFAVDNFRELAVDPFSFLRIWEGGLVFYGGVAGGLVALIILSRRLGLRFISLTDVFAAPLLLAHSIGRLGCFAAGCCYGRETDVPWAVHFTHPASLAPRYVSLHPTQLYESAGNFILFLLLYAYGRSVPKSGRLSALYSVSYGLFRFIIEYWRGDDRGLYRFGLSPSQGVAALLIAFGIGIFIYEEKNRKA